jgi:hypothetical protein
MGVAAEMRFVCWPCGMATLFAALLVLAGWALAPAAEADSFSWSSPIVLDQTRHGLRLTSVACPFGFAVHRRLTGSVGR